MMEESILRIALESLAIIAGIAVPTYVFYETTAALIRNHKKRKAEKLFWKKVCLGPRGRK